MPRSTISAVSTCWSTTPASAPGVRADILDTSVDSYDEVMNINLRGPFFLTQRVAEK